MVNFKDFKIDYVAKATYDGKVVYACMTCHKSIMKKRTPCEAVYNKLYVEFAPKPLQHLRKLEKVLISKRILFKKVEIMHGKGKFAKIKGKTCNIPVETDTVSNVLQRPINNNGLVLVKRQRHSRYRGYVYFETVLSSAIYDALNYSKEKTSFTRYFDFLWFKQSRNSESVRHFSK